MKSRNLTLSFIISVTCIVLHCLDVFSQSSPISVTSPIVMPVTPEASAMAKYVSYPINYSTGKIDISIPLYEIKAGDIILPITLSYDASGLKPKEYSGRIATGWTLNAEPSIMRYVKGVADEDTYGYLNTVYNPYANNDYLRQINRGLHDEEPDEFHYQLASGGGTCYIGVDNKYFMIPHPFNEDKIEANGLNGIRITDPNGIRFEFGFGNNRELTNQTTTRWMCDRIFSSTTSAQLTFDYTQCIKPSPTICSLNDYVMVEDNVAGSSNGDIKMTDSKDGINSLYRIDQLGNTTHLGTDATFGQYNKYASAIIKGQNLNHIYFDNGTVTFTWDAFTLTRMVVHDKENNLIRTVQFYSSKYNSNTELTKLDSVVISKDGSLEQHVYKFLYDRSESVPPMVTKNIDHWGFYNAYENYNDNRSSVPAATVFSKQSITSRDSVSHTIGGRNRNSDGFMAQVGILKKIIYPTGLQTTFSFEGNIARYITFSPEPGGFPFGGTKYIIPFPVGGLRIKRIFEYDPRIKELTYKNFKDDINYENEGQPDRGFGVVRKIVSPNDYLSVQSMSKVIYCNNSYINTRIRTWGAMPLSTITYRNGVIIYYDHVIENEYSNAAESLNLVTKYYYETPYSASFKFNFETRNPTIPFEPTRQDDYQETSLIKKIEKYKNDALLTSTEYEYDVKFANHSTYQVEAARTYQTIIFKDGENCVTQLDTYKREHWFLDNRWKELKTETHKEFFDSGKVLENKKTYHYQSTPTYSVITNTKPLEIVSTNSNGQTVEDHYRYSTDIINPYGENLGNQLLSFNIKSIPVEYKHIEGTDTAYTRNYFSGIHLNQVKIKNKPGPEFKSRLFFNRYDSYGNIADVSTNANIHTCYLWSYNNQHPIAKIENITYSELLTALAKNETWVTELGNKIKPNNSDYDLINGLRTLLPKSLVTTYVYKPLTGVLSITDPKNATTFFEYDSLGRLKKTYIMENGTAKVIQENTYKLKM